MKRLWFSLIMSFCTIISFGLAMVPFIQLTNGLADLIRRNEDSYTVELNMIFFLPIMVLGLIEAADYLWNKRKNKSSFWIYPLIMPSDDERERAITAKASHAAFLAIWAVAPVCAGAMCFYPLFEENFPIYPIFVVLMIPLIQITVYYLKIRKIYL
ncbi:hypothetical protein NIE88_17995 [Sporolactobacillus shoreicorticis]|uniref:DUF2178 domain-containing protein n=1 Tax=Sporolactobacillus shoreicorticis TaxID=1923877 RepID=A0ABW5S2R8_9BACL|nr:hypothetical protein [Sporolactobacillus shoreicorticis]MCO7127640.1 hypothetical protein [Sporolactobacillus shoreicorticis]